jgi:hypothetical protein
MCTRCSVPCRKNNGVGASRRELPGGGLQGRREGAEQSRRNTGDVWGRNKTRFPSDFVFRLTKTEVRNLESFGSAIDVYLDGDKADTPNRSQIATGSVRHRTREYLPYAFTEHGALMAATVLNSAKAVQMSLFVIRAFVKMREQISTRSDWEKRVAQIENVLLAHDEQIRDLFETIRPLLLPPPDPKKKGIGFHVRESRAGYRARSRSRTKAAETRATYGASGD